jgi:hypothetical protein
MTTGIVTAPNMKPTLVPKFAYTGLIRYGVPQIMAREQIQLLEIANNTVLERSLFAGISPTISGTIGPQVAEYEKLNIDMKAMRHLLAASLPGAASETIANVSMQIEFTVPPTKH